MPCASPQPPAGLLIEIKKVSRSAPPTPPPYWLVLGYYSQISIKAIQTWPEFSPEVISRSRLQSELEEGSDRYPIRLCFPGAMELDRLTQKLPDLANAIRKCYDAWMFNQNALTTQNPCVTVVLVNLMDSFKYDKCMRKNTFTNLWTDLWESLRTACGGDTPASEQIFSSNCCVLPCLGYADYAILFTEKSWDVGIRLPALLRQQQWENLPIVSADYSLHAYVYTPTNEPTASQFPDGTCLSCRMALHPGYSIEHVWAALSEDIRNRVRYFEINDVADFLITGTDAESSAAILRLLLRSRGVLKQAGEPDLTEQMILASKSRLQYEHEINLLASDPGMDHSGLESEMSVLNDLRKVLCDYYEILKKHHNNLRQANALLETELLLRNIFGKHHSRDMSEVLNPVLTAFTKCMSIMTDSMEKDYSSISAVCWKDFRATLELFRDRVGGFVRDLSRSDCFAMEAEQYNHSSVSSSTVLLLDLNRVINALNRTLGPEGQEHGFLLTSGGCDLTVSHRMFPFLEGEKNANGIIEEAFPFVMQVSEGSLVDCSGVLLRLTHEAFHFCGDRKRDERARSICRFLSACVGRWIARRLLEKYDLKASAWLRSIGVNDLSIDALHKNVYEPICDKLAQEISVSYEGMLCSHLPTAVDDTHLMAKNFPNWLDKTMKSLSSTKFSIHLCDLVCTYRAQYLKDGRDYWQSQSGCVYSWFDLWLSHECQLMLPQSNARNQLCNEVKLLLTNVDTWLRYIIRPVQSIFSEAFSDVAACTVLNASPLDYLLSFLGEGMSLDDTLPYDPVHTKTPYFDSASFNGAAAKSTENCFRLLGVLHVAWQIDTASDVRALSDNLKAAASVLWPGLDRESRCNALLCNIEDMFHILDDPMEKARYDSLCEYLCLCKKDLLSKEADYTPYRDLFQKIRLYDGKATAQTMLEVLDGFAMTKEALLDAACV